MFQIFFNHRYFLERRNFLHDQSQLQFLKPEKEILGTSKEYDLNVGFEDRVESEYIFGSMDLLLLRQQCC